MSPQQVLVYTLLVLALSCNALAESLPFTCEERNYSQPPRGELADAVKLVDNAFVRAKDGAVQQMQAVSWFGVHDNGSVPIDALWSGGSAAATNMPAIAFQLRAQGFNGIRLPFTFSDLRATPKNMWSKQGCRKVTMGAAALQAPADGGVTVVRNPEGEHCHWFLPDTSSLDRYLWSIQWFAANGFYVLLENRPADDDITAGDDQSFVNAWQWLWRSVACLPNFKSDLEGRVFVDLLGNPDVSGHRWEPRDLAEGMTPGITQLYLGAMDALWADTPSALTFFIAGAGQGGIGNWGSGFVTDKAAIAVNDYSDPNAFFKALLDKPYRSAVVISPNVYDSQAPIPVTESGPSTLPAFPLGPSPVKILDTTFSYLAKQGYCVDNDCQRFPIAIGEFASKLTTRPQLDALNTFAAHLNKASVGFGGVGTWRFWDFNVKQTAS